jgi:glycosyltransferase involved in cell wall biosynthesis
MGAEGIDVAHERDLLLADSPAAIAEQTVRLLRDGALADRLSQAGRRLAQERYSWPSIVAALEDEYRAALRRKLQRSEP